MAPIFKDVNAGGSTDDRHYYYNEDWQLLETRKTESDTPLEQFIWHPYYIDALALRSHDANGNGSISSDEVHYTLHHANFNVTALVNSSGDVLERYHYTPYGEVTVLDDDFSLDADNQSDIANVHLYTGRERDPETGLQLNRHRFYHAPLGRWVTRDPIAYLLGGYNLYQYVGGRPTLATDKFGLFTPPDSFEYEVDGGECTITMNCPGGQSYQGGVGVPTDPPGVAELWCQIFAAAIEAVFDCENPPPPSGGNSGGGSSPKVSPSKGPAGPTRVDWDAHIAAQYPCPDPFPWVNPDEPADPTFDPTPQFPPLLVVIPNPIGVGASACEATAVAGSIGRQCFTRCAAAIGGLLGFGSCCDSDDEPPPSGGGGW